MHTDGRRIGATNRLSVVAGRSLAVGRKTLVSMIPPPLPLPAPTGQTATSSRMAHWKWPIFPSFTVSPTVSTVAAIGGGAGQGGNMVNSSRGTESHVFCIQSLAELAPGPTAGSRNWSPGSFVPGVFRLGRRLLREPVPVFVPVLATPPSHEHSLTTPRSNFSHRQTGRPDIGSRN